MQVEMDPRSKATAVELEQQQKLGLEIFGEVQRARQAMAEIKATNSKLVVVTGQLKDRPELRTQAEKLSAAVDAIEKGNKTPADKMGLETATSGLQSVLRVVEGGDRTAPQQALDAYQIVDEAAKRGVEAWKQLKGGDLTAFNQAMQKAGLQPITMLVVEQDGDLAATN
jgi:hypothetical protein